MVKKGKIVVILGAGASVDAGLPTSQQLTQIIYDELSQDRRQKREDVRLLGYVISRLQARNARLGQSPYVAIEVEELFDALNSLATKNSMLVSEFVERWDRSLDAIHDEIDGRAIQRKFDALAINAVRRSQNGHRYSGFSHEYADFARLLQPRREVSTDRDGVPMFQQPFFNALFKNLEVDSERVSYLKPMLESPDVSLVASLNYDMAVELCAAQSQMEIDYGLDRWSEQKLVSWRRGDSLKLLKLHGSMNWSGTQEEPVIRTDEIKAHEKRVMIFGGISNKLSANGPFLQFLSKLESGLNDADEIVIVGYSFRDAHINALLARRRMTKRSTRMTVIDPNPPHFWKAGFQAGDVTRESGGRKYTYNLEMNMVHDGAKAGIKMYFADR